MKGSEWWREKVPEQLGEGYLQAILQAIDDGHAVIDFKTIIADDLEFQVMRAPLAIGDTDDHVFLLGLSGFMFDIIAQKLGVMRMTPKLWDLAAECPDHEQIGPHTLPTLIGKSNGAVGMTKTAAKAHSDAILRSRSTPCAFIMGCIKSYVIWTGIRGGYDCEYAWRLPGKVGWGSRNSTNTGWVVQPQAWAHSYRKFWDYSMGLVGMLYAGQKQKKPVDFRHIVFLRSLALSCGLPQEAPFVVHPEFKAKEKAKESQPAPVVHTPTLRLGSKGPEVTRWQQRLLADGFDLGKWRDDGDFGKQTHNATVGWQSERGLPKTGIVTDVEWDNRSPVERNEPDDRITATVWCRNFTMANRAKVDNVVIHTIEIAEASTSADRTAAWGAGPQAPQASWHYAFDDDSTILCVPEEHVAWAAPGLNRQGIQFEHAGYARQTTAQWEDPFSRRMLQRSAKMCAAVCKRWDIPIVFIDAAGLLRGERGITTHYQVTLGPGKGLTTHGDPGRYFPMSSYLSMVQAAM